MMYVEAIRGTPYMTKEVLAKEFHMCKSTVSNRMKEIEQQVKDGRYNDYAVIQDGKIVLINELVFIDYMKYRKMLLDKNAKKYVPKFRPDLIIQTLGWNNRIVKVDEEDES